MAKLPKKVNEQRLARIFSFLQKNRSYNQTVQNLSYREWLSEKETPIAKLKSLLFHCVHTQSQPNLNALAKFWQEFHDRGQKFPNDVQQLRAYLAGVANPGASYHGNEFDRLWLDLTSADGWGQKTAALFVKALVEIHTDPINRPIRFLLNFAIEQDTQLYVPVDTVLTYIFKTHLSDGLTLSFNQINEILRARYKLYGDFLIWDDLWFWGFITQRVQNGVRHLDLNMPKYWAIAVASPSDVSAVEEKAKQFIEILRS